MCSPIATISALKERPDNASQSSSDASFIVEGETDRFVDRTSVFERSRQNPAARESD